MFGGMNRSLVIAVCLVFLATCFSSLSVNAAAKPTLVGEITLEDASGVETDTYYLGEAMYIDIEASGGAPNGYYLCKVIDPQGVIMYQRAHWETSWYETLAYQIQFYDPVGTWTVELERMDRTKNGWKTKLLDRDLVDVYEAPGEFWYGCTIPDGHYINFYELEYLGLPGGHVDQYADPDDVGYYMLGVSTETHVVGPSGALSVSGWFKMYDTFTSDLWPTRRYVRVYALDEAATTVLAEVEVLTWTDAVNTWQYRDDQILTGLAPGSTVSIAVGRQDAWAYNDWQLMAEWAGVEVEQQQQQPADWIVMVYLDGDTNDFVTQQAIHNLDEIEAASYVESVRTVAFIDISGNWPDAGNSYARYYDFYGGQRTLVQTSGVEVNMGDPSTLATFMNWAYSYCSNDASTRWALILMDHGQGYKGLCWDSSHFGDGITVNELESALASFRTTLGRNVNLVGFDACIMQSLEVPYEIRESVNVVVASEEVEYVIDEDVGTGGWPYDLVLTNLAGNPSANEEVFGAMIVNAYQTYWEPFANNPSWGRATMSAIRVAYVDEIAYYAGQLALALGLYDPADVRTVRNETEEFSPFAETIDLKDFCDQLEASSEIPVGRALEIAMSNVRQYIQSSVIAEWHNPGNPCAYGVAIYFPFCPENYNADQNDYDYSSLDFSIVEPEWEERIRIVLGIQ